LFQIWKGAVESEELVTLMRVHKNRWQYARLIRLWCEMAQRLLQQLGIAMLTGAFVTWREFGSLQALARRHGMIDDSKSGKSRLSWEENLTQNFYCRMQLKDLVGHFLFEACQTVHCDLGALCMISPDTHELNYWHQDGSTGRLPSGQSLVRKVCLDPDRRPLCMGTNDLSAWEDPSFKARIDGINLHSDSNPFRSILVVPLYAAKNANPLSRRNTAVRKESTITQVVDAGDAKSRDTENLALGALICVNKASNHGACFNPEDANSLASLCHLALPAIQNAVHYSKVVEDEQRRKRILEMRCKLSLAPTLEETLLQARSVLHREQGMHVTISLSLVVFRRPRRM